MTRLLKDKFPHPIGFGAASISGEGGGYGFGEISEKDALDLLHFAFEKGFRLFDSAPIYGFGLSEKRLGLAFKKNRDKVFITTKSGVTWHPNKRVDMSNDPGVTIKMLEQSLRDLQSDYIDLYMIHWPDSKVDIRKSLEVIAKAKEQGKVKHIGLCNTNEEDLNKSKDVTHIEVVQSQFNVFEKSVQEQIFDQLVEENISFQSWGTLDKGILSGSVTADREKSKKYDSSDCRKSAPWWKQSEILEKTKKAQKLRSILEERNINILSFCVGHNLSYQPTDMVLVGPKNFKQVETLVEALKNLPDQKTIEEVLKELN